MKTIGLERMPQDFKKKWARPQDGAAPTETLKAEPVPKEMPKTLPATAAKVPKKGRASAASSSNVRTDLNEAVTLLESLLDTEESQAY